MQTYFRFQRILLLSLLLGGAAYAQPTSLQQLRDQLVATNGWREADVVAVVSERALNDTAARMAGLEIKLSNKCSGKVRDLLA